MSTPERMRLNDQLSPNPLCIIDEDMDRVQRNTKQGGKARRRASGGQRQHRVTKKQKRLAELDITRAVIVDCLKILCMSISSECAPQSTDDSFSKLQQDAYRWVQDTYSNESNDVIANVLLLFRNAEDVQLGE